MSSFENCRLSKPSNVLLQDLNGEAVLLNLGNNQYYGLDENSYHMFQVLVSSSSAQAAYEHLLQEFEVEPEQLRIDLDQFLKLLLDNGLIQYSDDQPG